MAPLRELELAMEPLATEIQEAVGGSGIGGPQAAAQVGGLDLEFDFSQKITLPTPITVNWTADATGIGAGVSLSGFLAGLGGGAAVVCLVLMIMWKCFSRRSPARSDCHYVHVGGVDVRQQAAQQRADIAALRPYEIHYF
ncbi:unnamed protein product [Oikopleura dioica]|nr:unnamed protein product [Oikopleura dioica]